MAQHFHRAGYQTAVFTSNPNAGSLSDLQRGVDVFRDKGLENHSASSVELHDDFWKWRDEYPGKPFWVHFQTTDVHEPHHPVVPFAGLYISPARRDTFFDWLDRMWDFEGWMGEEEAPETVLGFYRWRLEQIGVDPVRFFDTQRGLYDETMAHQDYQLGQLVERLKAAGEWENTLLIIASDHGHPAGTFSRFGRGLIDPPPPEWEGALFDSYRTRIPLIFVWPGHIAPGQRFREHVSMIDMLPTVLELAGLPMPEVMQGQSLAPLLLGREGWEPRPVIIEQLQNDIDTGEFTGHIEVIDGRWGASLEIYPERAEGEPEVEPAGFWRAARPHREEVPRLLLYDLFTDPFTLHNVNEQYPDLVEKYTAFLEAQWEAHQALGQYFTQAGEVALTPEQLRTLRSLGYIQ
jgi:arylsulfatase A-like enzyme